MTIPTLETIANYLVVLVAILGAFTAAFWLSLVIWAFRDMRLRSRDPFAQLLAALLVAALPFVGIILYLILRPPETLAERYERALEEEALLQEIEERPRCPKCSRIVADPWAMCPTCTTELKKQCPVCFHLLELGWDRCPHCTARQPQNRPKLTPAMLQRSINRPQVVIAPPATPQIAPQQTQPVATPAQRTFRRYRRTRLGAGTRSQPIPGKFVVGDSHPTVVQLGRPAEDTPTQIATYPESLNTDNEITEITDPPPQANGLTPPASGISG